MLDSGDLFFKKFSASYPESEIRRLEEKARLILKSFNLMGYQAIGIGDDDLSLGKKFLLELSKMSNFTFISSNLIDEDSGKPLFQRYIIKEMNGLKVGIFSLIAPEVFLSQSDLRKKGLTIRDPSETAQEIIRELTPQTDLVILLSHLSYPKDVDLAQRISGIHIIVGGHVGVNLSNPPVINDKIIFQTSSRGMYAGRFDLTLLNDKTSFYNVATKRSLEANLNKFQSQLTSVQVSEAEKAQWERTKENTEKALHQLEGKSYFTNTISPLNQQVEDHPDIKNIVDAYKSKFPETSTSSAHDSRGSYNVIGGQRKKEGKKDG